MMNFSVKKDECTCKILHDLKTPLNAQIVALGSFLSTVGDKISQEEKDLIELTLNSCNYTKRLIETFISVHNLNNESFKLTYEKFNIVDLIKSSIKDSQILLKYNQLDIKFESNEEIIVNADKIYIKKVIDNLLAYSISNAFKNTLIEINLDIFNAQVLFEVKNKSSYIEKNVLKDIFEKCKTQTSLYNKSAVSLCLYFSQKIIHAHLGSMIARSNVDNINVLGFLIPKN